MRIPHLLVARADCLFRYYLLKRWGAPDKIQCFTCAFYFHPDFIDVGHIISRGSYATRWLEDNCRPQCRHCNRNLHGNNLLDKVSTEDYDWLRHIALDPKFRFSEEFIKSIIEKYGS